MFITNLITFYLPKISEISSSIHFDKEVALHPVIFNFLQKFNQIDSKDSSPEINFQYSCLQFEKKIRLHVILHRSIKYTGKKQLKKSYRVDTFTRNLIVLQFVTSCGQMILKVLQNIPNFISNANFFQTNCLSFISCRMKFKKSQEINCFENKFFSEPLNFWLEV